MLGEDSSDITLGNWYPLMTKGSMCRANHFRLKGKAWLVGTQSSSLYILYFVNVLQ